MKKYFLLFFVSTVSWGRTNAPDFSSLFTSGLKAYQESRFEDAQKDFLLALQQDPQSTAASVNLALSYEKMQKHGYAAAYFRRALQSDPHLSAAQRGLDFSISKLPVKEIPHKIEFLENLRQVVLIHFSLSSALALCALLLLATGWFLLAWMGDRRRAIRTNESPRGLPASLIFLGILLACVSLMAGAKLFSDLAPRATIVDGPVDILSAPDAEGVKITEFYDGFEVLQSTRRDDWVQVTYPGGPTGWIPSRHLIFSKGPL